MSSYARSFRRDLAELYELRRAGRSDEAAELGEFVAAELRSLRAFIDNAEAALARAGRDPFEGIPEAR